MCCHQEANLLTIVLYKLTVVTVQQGFPRYNVQFRLQKVYIIEEKDLGTNWAWVFQQILHCNTISLDFINVNGPFFCRTRRYSVPHRDGDVVSLNHPLWCVLWLNPGLVSSVGTHPVKAARPLSTTSFTRRRVRKEARRLISAIVGQRGLSGRQVWPGTLLVLVAQLSW